MRDTNFFTGTWSLLLGTHWESGNSESQRSPESQGSDYAPAHSGFENRKQAAADYSNWNQPSVFDIDDSRNYYAQQNYSYRKCNDPYPKTKGLSSRVDVALKSHDFLGH